MNTGAPATPSEPFVLRSDVTSLTLNRTRQFNALSMEMLDALEGVSAFAGKRKPQWQGE